MLGPSKVNYMVYAYIIMKAILLPKIAFIFVIRMLRIVASLAQRFIFICLPH